MKAYEVKVGCSWTQDGVQRRAEPGQILTDIQESSASVYVSQGVLVESDPPIEIEVDIEDAQEGEEE